jgi:hypothetical protein
LSPKDGNCVLAFPDKKIGQVSIVIFENKNKNILEKNH